MGRPENGIYIIQGEVNLVVTAMRRNSRWTSHSNQEDDQDPLLNSFSQLKDILNTIADIQELAPNEFLSPFLEVIRSEDTTGPITGLALTSVNKFLSYGLIDANCVSAGAAIENIADAVTHARFVGTDPSNDEVVLMKILHVLRTLLLTPAGAMLTNEAVCEIMQSCFRICFEMRLSELLRKSAEHTLMDMVQLLFCRLPHFKEDPKWATSIKKLKMRTGGMEQTRGGRFRKRSPKPSKRGSKKSQSHNIIQTQPMHLAEPQPTDLGAMSHPARHEEPTPDPHQQGSLPDAPVTNEISDGEKCGGNTDPGSGVTDTGPIQPPDCIPTPPESDVTSPDDYVQSLSMEATIATTPCDVARTVVDIHKGFKDASDLEGTHSHVSMDINDAGHQLAVSADTTHFLQVPNDDEMARSSSEQDLNLDLERVSLSHDLGEDESVHSAAETSDGASVHDHTEYVNPRGVRFMPHHQQSRDGSSPLIPYGLPCVRELFRFLVSLTNPLDRHNTDVMVHMGLSLLTAALESGADSISSFSSLTCLVKDDLLKNLFFLLQSDRLSLFAASIRVCFLLFESMRNKLKFQMEMYFNKLMDIIVSDSPRVSYEQREVALESIVQLLRIPGLVTELYLNYDCDLYCSNLFEDLMKMLSKNAFPVSGLFTTHLLSLDALLAVIDSIEQHCHHRVLHTAKKLGDGTTPASDRSNTEVKPDVVSSATSETDDVPVPAPPPPSGYSVAEKMKTSQDTDPETGKQKVKDTRSGPRIRPNRMKISPNIPTEEELAAIKHKKKLYHTGSEQFNMKPSKGIAFLQSHGLLSEPIDAGEIVTFLKENPKLDKKQIGEYISDRKNSVILEAFQKSFNFDDVRIDEALRMYLESFRLPGEAPVIARLLEHFAEHWHKMNGEPVANTDAAFTLAYAVLMLNTDQHNTNAKKQNVPMNIEDFKKNLKKVNGGNDFDEEMLDEVFHAIKSDEIVMPSEQYGIVRENYLWKMLIRRGNYKEGLFTHAPTGAFDRDLFSIVWGPTVAALSFVFDKSLDEVIIQKAVSGFRKCAMISAHYGISDVFDNLVISLCKFTTLLSSAESAEIVPISFGNNNKAQLAARTVFGLAHRHGDILREGWKNIIDCMLQLYRAKLLPELLVKVEDFIDPSGKISLIREETNTNQRSESGVLSSFYSYFTLTEPTLQRGPSPEEQEASKRAHKCITECHVEQLIQESKFLRVDSLQELLKALIFASQCPDVHDSLNGLSRCDEDSAVFFLELLIKVVLQNRDRISPFWQNIRDHIYNLIVNATESSFLVERAVVGLLRLAIRLLRREEIASQVLASMRMILMMKPVVIHAGCRQVAYGLHDLLKTNAANIHSMTDWFTLFTLLEVVGAGTNPPPIMQVGVQTDTIVQAQADSGNDTGAQSDSELTSSTHASSEGGERGYTSDSELYEASSRHNTKTQAASTTRTNINGEMEIKPLPDSHGSWVLQIDPVESKPENANSKVYNKHHHKHPGTPDDGEDGGHRPLKRNQFSIDLNESLTYHDPKSLTKCCETLAFLVRDAVHVTPHNFESCVHTIRTFVEASLNGGHPIKTHKHSPTPEKKKSFRKKKGDSNMNRSKSSPSHLTQLHESDEEKDGDGYHSLSIQLLDLMHTLHTRAATIFSSWAEEERRHQMEPPASGQDLSAIDAGTSTLWTKCWCPLLQGIACLCCDSRRQVRSQALTYLQRALLVHDLQTLSAYEWESCFNKVLFPLLSKLLEPINAQDPGGIEETRMRASTLLCKVFLQHLTPLLSLSTFTALWLTILEFMDKYMHADRSDLLCEAIPESLKNMLLVMHTAGILQSGESDDESQLWRLTWDRIDTFLPNLRDEVFKPHEISETRRRSRGDTPVQQQPAQEGSTTGTGNHSAGAPDPDTGTSATQCKNPQQEQYYQQQYAQQAHQYAQQQHAASAQQTPSSAVPVHGTATDSTDGSGEGDRRSESYLTSTGAPGPSQYVLHPPLPATAGPTPADTTTSLHPPLPATAGPTPADTTTSHTVPLLLNPDIIQHANMPIISPQNTPEKSSTDTVVETL